LTTRYEVMANYTQGRGPTVDGGSGVAALCPDTGKVKSDPPAMGIEEWLTREAGECSRDTHDLADGLDAEAPERQVLLEIAARYLLLASMADGELLRQEPIILPSGIM
jgi:hypothetical protein